MSSSTKTNGAGIARTSQTRSAAEATTIPASHAQSGTRATRARLPVGDTAEIVLGRGELPGGGAHRRTRVRPLGEELQRRREVGHFVVTDGNLARDSVRKLAEPA